MRLLGACVIAAACAAASLPSLAQNRPDQTDLKQCAALTGANYERCVRQFREGGGAGARDPDPAPDRAREAGSSNRASPGDSGLPPAGVRTAPDPAGSPPPRSPTSRSLP